MATRDRIHPTPHDLGRIQRIYARDFARFSYVPDRQTPDAPAWVMNPEDIGERDVALRRRNRPAVKILRRLGG